MNLVIKKVVSPSFFQEQLEMLEHFGFLEFLNLSHSAAHDS